jgi:ParB-like chromosome segregation protein Spo0J
MKKPPAPTLESVGIEFLIPYANNARKHSDEQVAQIAASIREFGFNNPVLIDADNGIIAGHGRVMAARKLGMTLVPCIRLRHLSEAQRRAYILADNRLAETGGGWDEELLRVELAGLTEDGEIDPTLAGWSQEEIERMLGAEPGEEEDQGDAPGSDFAEQYAVTVICKDERHQQDIYEKLTAEGLTCKVVCV